MGARVASCYTEVRHQTYVCCTQTYVRRFGACATQVGIAGGKRVWTSPWTFACTLFKIRFCADCLDPKVKQYASLLRVVLMPLHDKCNVKNIMIR